MQCLDRKAFPDDRLEHTFEEEGQIVLPPPEHAGKHL